MSQGYTLIVYSGPVEGREDEYNKWYDEVHLAEFTALPGVVSGRRFQVAEGKPAPYAAVYELTSPPDEVMASMNAGVKAGTVHWSDAFDNAQARVVTLIPRG
jgi:hypothetical protein